VLHEAFDPRNRLLERVKFLSIFSTNLDEFYMVRVAGLRRQIAAGVHATAADGIPQPSQLDAIARRVGELMDLQRNCLCDLLLPELDKHGIRIVGMKDLDDTELERIGQFFDSQVYPVLTPLALDPGIPHPYITNLAVCIAIQLRDSATGESRLAHIKVPKSLPRWVPFGRENHFVPLEQLIAAKLDTLFPGMEILDHTAFRVTRYSDLELPVFDDDDDLITAIEEQV
jgi:polyphosphate kinase